MTDNTLFYNIDGTSADTPRNDSQNASSNKCFSLK